MFDALDMDCRDVEAAKRERALRNRRYRQRRSSEFTLDTIKVNSGGQLLDDDDDNKFGQEIPDFFAQRAAAAAAGSFDDFLNEIDDGEDSIGFPPILPPHLLQVILNKDTPLACEPTLLPRPNHVMLNHMYALSIKDRVMIMCATKRFRKKYVTTVLYRPTE